MAQILMTVSAASIQADRTLVDRLIAQLWADGTIKHTIDAFAHACNNGDVLICRADIDPAALEDAEVELPDDGVALNSMAHPTRLKPDFNTGIVSMLTELLRRAQAGEINQVALVFTEPGDDHRYGTWISDRESGSTLLLIGAIADLQHTVLVAHNEQQGR